MLTATDWSVKNGLSVQWACKMARQGRIEGAKLEGRVWMIPDDAPIPEKRRSGRAPNPNSAHIVRDRMRAEAKAARLEIREKQNSAVSQWMEIVLSGGLDERQYQIWQDLSLGCRFVDFGMKLNPHGEPIEQVNDWDADDEGIMLALSQAMREGKIGLAEFGGG